MSLRKQLHQILLELLPPDPRDAIKGTELIRAVRMRLDGDYSDASLRYHFSVMSFDPGSPIAKVEKGQGYYRRGTPLSAVSGARELVALTQGRLDDLGDYKSADQVLLRIRKFDAVVRCYAESRGLFPLELRELLNRKESYGQHWNFPEMLWLDWEKGDFEGETFRLDKAHVALKKSLGLPAYRLTAVRIRLVARPENVREDLFQAMSAALWSHAGELVYACPIEDESLLTQLRLFSALTGITVTTLGLTLDKLAELPPPEQILHATSRELDALIDRLDVTRIATAPARPHLNWEVLEPLMLDYPVIAELFAWLQKSLEKGAAEPFDLGSPEK